MGTSSSALELGKKFEKAATALPKAQKEAVFQAALAAKATFTEAAVGAGLTPGKPMHGVGHFGAPWRIFFTMQGGDLNASALVRSKGPLWLLEGDTKPHEIEAGMFARALRFDNGEMVARLHHPGTHGKHFAVPAREKAKAQAPPIVARAQRGALIKSGFG